jgi:hypothetical protein
MPRLKPLAIRFSSPPFIARPEGFLALALVARQNRAPCGEIFDRQVRRSQIRGYEQDNHARYQVPDPCWYVHRSPFPCVLAATAIMAQ